jgi:hypothetical protein
MLNERTDESRSLIRRIVTALACDRARTLLDAERVTEVAGGTMTLEGVRRRTLGEVFFYLTAAVDKRSLATTGSTSSVRVGRSGRQ